MINVNFPLSLKGYFFDFFEFPVALHTRINIYYYTNNIYVPTWYEKGRLYD